MANISSITPAKPEAKKTFPKINPQEGYENFEAKSEAIGYFTTETIKKPQIVELGSVNFNAPSESSIVAEAKDNASATFSSNHNPAFDSWAQMITQTTDFLYGVTNRASTTIVDTAKDTSSAVVDLVKNITGTDSSNVPKNQKENPNDLKKKETATYITRWQQTFNSEKARIDQAKQYEMFQLAMRMGVSFNDESESSNKEVIKINSSLDTKKIQNPYHLHAIREAQIMRANEVQKKKKEQSVAQITGGKGIQINNFEGGHAGSKGQVNMSASGGGAG